MSQIIKLLYGGTGSNLGSIIQTDVGSAQAGADNIINALGGANVNTSGASNSVTVNLDSDITLTAADIGNIRVSGQTIASLSGNINFTTIGTGKVVYEDQEATDNSALYFGAGKKLKSTPLLDGQILVGSSGNEPVATTLTAGTNVSITNSANNITIANSGAGAGGGHLAWNLINWVDYNQATSIEMAVNNGYIVNWNTSTSGPALTFTFPDPSNLSIGDTFTVAVLNGYGSPGSSTASVYIDPTVHDYGVQSAYQALGVYDFSAPMRPITQSGGKPTITFVYVGNPGNNVGTDRNLFQVLTVFGSWRWES